MLPVVHIGPAALQTSTLALIVALWLGAYLAEREFHRRGLRGDDAWSIVALGVAVTILVARLAYIAQNFSAYAEDWLQVFSLTPGTLDVPIGVLAGGIAVIAYLQRRRLALASVADGFVLGALVALAILALGQFLAGDGFGMPTDLPWAVPMWGVARHPVQVYELIGIGIGFYIFARWQPARGGTRALIALAWYSAMRVFVDGFRADAAFLPGGYRASQVIALLVLLGALWLVLREQK
ncbi:MAG: prolipoprotein diacylglyceryl transferase [Chloroflexi bacterium]|nr:prolipoprotein diacylglyceryl transferase [Chloroflexota bacterium]